MYHCWLIYHLKWGKMASIGFPHRADSFSAALAPRQRILKRFGAQTLLAAASQFDFNFFFSLFVLFGSQAFLSNTSSSSRQKKALKGLWESAGHHGPGLSPGLRSPSDSWDASVRQEWL